MVLFFYFSVLNGILRLLRQKKLNLLPLAMFLKSEKHL